MIICAVLAALAASPATAQVSASGGDVPRTTFITSMDQEFGKMDANKDGFVTRAEAEAYQRATAVARSRQQNQALFARLDKDKNGQLSPAEFAAINSGPPQVNAIPLMNQLDSNKDGKISIVEHRAGKLAYFDRIDTDKNGVVTIAEMKAAGVIK